jgi:hypothetical protein
MSGTLPGLQGELNAGLRARGRAPEGHAPSVARAEMSFDGRTSGA